MENLVFFYFVFAMFLAGAKSATFTFINKCPYTVWAGTLNNADKPQLNQTGFKLDQGATLAVSAPETWGGRMWGRTQCTNDTNGRFSCITADCGTGQIPCNVSGATPPATLAEFTLGTNGSQDYYDISLVDGFNVPFSITPQGGSGNCSKTGCFTDVNPNCPPELRLAAPDGTTAGCKSACEAFKSDEYCCKGEYNYPDKCKPSGYSMYFKNACPLAYSYAYDDKTSTFTCTGADYHLTYCP